VRAGLRIYAPVGSHEDLLAYLVRRLLENGANTSFVNRMADDEAPLETLIADPVMQLAKETPRRNPRIPAPGKMYSPRRNSSGFLWSDPVASAPVLAAMADALREPAAAAPVIAGLTRDGKSRPMFDPSDRNRLIGQVTEATQVDAQEALTHAFGAYGRWDGLGGDARAAILERAADLYEANRAKLMALAVREGGKTLATALGEVREAVDYLRYYAAEARRHFSAPV
jgi:RHH-type proline utilization regulon transcriptional repressor/proline dehydrogenase/delta 1-pyrroline-5-carboxylate dehydrogenase